MTLRTYANRRDKAEAAIVEVLRKAGCSVIRMDKPVDLLIGFRGTTHLVEIKTGKGKLTKAQEEFRVTWRGAYFYILRSPDDALKALQVWAALRITPANSVMEKAA